MKLAGRLGEHGKLRRLAQAQATYRRLATLVAQGAPPEELFQAFAEQLGELLPGEVVALGRYETDGRLSPVGLWCQEDEAAPGGAGRVLEAAGLDVAPDESEPAETAGQACEPTGEQDFGDVLETVTAAVDVEGRPWGAMAALSASRALAADAAERLNEFAGLMATVIANAESRSSLAASRARIVAAADEARRRIERDLHDGAQQRLVSLALQLRGAEAQVPREATELRSELSDIAEGMAGLLEDLRTMARGVHPAVLDTGGLGPALRALGRRSPVPVELRTDTTGRFPEQTEVAVYYVVSEALTNVAKHSHASAVRVEVTLAGNALRVLVADNGTGGANPQGGSGLVGLRDRVEAIGGSLELHSPPGAGTSLKAVLPLPATPER
jgi:signal transduction histidine kinase